MGQADSGRGSSAPLANEKPLAPIPTSTHLAGRWKASRKARPVSGHGDRGWVWEGKGAIALGLASPWVVLALLKVRRRLQAFARNKKGIGLQTILFFVCGFKE